MTKAPKNVQKQSRYVIITIIQLAQTNSTKSTEQGHLGGMIKTPELPHSDLTSLILNCCFEVMNELGTGFLESVYKNALVLALKHKDLFIEKEKSFEVYFREQKIGFYKADLVVEGSVIIELKCCKSLLPEHQAQVINYLKAANIPVALLINFGQRILDFKRLHHPSFHPASEGDHAYPVYFSEFTSE